MVFICPVVILGKGKEAMKHSFRKLLSVLLAAVMVFGGSTYFQLAELGNVLGFNVGYDAATRTVLINSK